MDYSVDNVFMYHAPKPEHIGKYEQIRDIGKEMVVLLNQLCPESREKWLAFTRVEEAVMWANAAIARNG